MRISCACSSRPRPCSASSTVSSTTANAHCPGEQNDDDRCPPGLMPWHAADAAFRGPCASAEHAARRCRNIAAGISTWPSQVAPRGASSRQLAWTRAMRHIARDGRTARTGTAPTRPARQQSARIGDARSTRAGWGQARQTRRGAARPAPSTDRRRRRYLTCRQKRQVR